MCSSLTILLFIDLFTITKRSRNSKTADNIKQYFNLIKMSLNYKLTQSCIALARNVFIFYFHKFDDYLMQKDIPSSTVSYNWNS